MQLKIGRLRGGFCVSWYVDGKRRRYQLNARTRKEAEAEALDVYAQHNRPTKAHTVADIWRAYQVSLGARPTAKTMDYTGLAVLDHFGHLRPDQIDQAACLRYDERRRSQGVSQGSVHTELGHLRSALRYARRVGHTESDIHIWRPAKPEKDKRILDAGEARRLIESAHDPHIRLAVILLLGTAGRVGAVLDLEWERVDFVRGTINLRVSDSNTRKGRAVVPMNGMTRAALSAAREAALTDYVIEYGGGPIKSIRKGFTNAVERSGIGHVRIHDLRHTAAVTMLAAGHPIELVAQVLGHSNVSMTYRVYGRYMPEHMAPAVDSLNFFKVV